MTDHPKPLTYKDFLTPEHLAVIHRSATEKVGVPVFFSVLDLSDLFQQAVAEPDRESLIPIPDLNDLPIDPEIKESMTNPNKYTVMHASDNPLTLAFSLLGYASGLGRKIECATMPVDAHGTVIRTAGLSSGAVAPAFFRQFESDPLTGAKALFGTLAQDIGVPDRMVMLGFISPNPAMN